MNKILAVIIAIQILPLYRALAQQETSSVISSEKGADEDVVSASALTRLNPFLSRDEERFYSEPKRPAFVVLGNYNLSATFRSLVSSESKAIINGMVCKIGDIIDPRDGKMLIEIQQQAVILRDAWNVEYILMLYK